MALSTTAFSQGVVFWHAGADILRSKSLDRNSYDSGDWFNRVDWTREESTFGSGLPPKADNEAKWPYLQPLLADETLKPGRADMDAAHAAAADLLRMRMSTPLFRLGSASAIQEKVSFPAAEPGVVAMHIDDTAGADADPELDGVLVVFNASPSQTTVSDVGDGWTLHELQDAGLRLQLADHAVQTAGVLHKPYRPDELVRAVGRLRPLYAGRGAVAHGPTGRGQGGTTTRARAQFVPGGRVGGARTPAGAATRS